MAPVEIDLSLSALPAYTLFSLCRGLAALAGVELGLGSILLMLLGTQWYILFNVVAGASAMPADLREMAHSYGIKGWHRFRKLFLPAIFPSLVTGWITAAGANVPVLAASVAVMAVMVVAFNRLVWSRLQHLASTRFSPNK